MVAASRIPCLELPAGLPGRPPATPPIRP